MQINQEKICDFMKEFNFNGYVLIAKDKEIIFNGGFGYSDIENKIPFKRDSVFRIGSITK